MKKTERKALEEKLLTAIKKVLQDNKTQLTNKTKKAVMKSIKKIAKKTAKKKSGVPTEKIKKPI